MRWEVQVAEDLTQDLVVFDGDCVLCSHSARFVHRNDRALRFRFVAIKSPYGRALAVRFGIDPEAPETNLAVLDGRVFFKLDAVIAVLAALPSWRWMAVLKVIPKPVRDWIYDRIARSRYAIFGRREQCWAGSADFQSRILERAP